MSSQNDRNYWLLVFVGIVLWTVGVYVAGCFGSMMRENQIQMMQEAIRRERVEQEK